MTMQTQIVLRAFLDDPERELYGLEIATHTGLLPGTTYPILVRLQRADWVSSRWEDIDPHDEQRPARRYYKLTPRGAELARQELERRSRGAASAARPWRWTVEEVTLDADATRPSS
jgi:PadR family transcriptional regulator, regulatory protein PadR